MRRPTTNEQGWTLEARRAIDYRRHSLFRTSSATGTKTLEESVQKLELESRTQGTRRNPQAAVTT